MPITKLRNFGQYGVITDIPPYDLPPVAWSDANNVRFVANRFEKMSGYAPTLQPSRDNTPAVFFAQEPETKAASVIYATGKNIYLLEGNVPTLINDGALDKYNASTQEPWGVATLSNVMVFNQYKDDPVAWVPGNATKKVIPLPGWGVPRSLGTGAANVKCEWKAKSIKAYKNYLLALNTTEEYFTPDPTDNTKFIKNAARNFPQRIRWSDVAEIGNLPTNWIEDDETKDGGFVDLADCIGTIVDGRPMRDFFLAYTDRETYIVKYVGGTLVFDVQKLFPDSGLLNPNCVTEFEGGNHFVISNDDIFIHDGSTRKSVATDLVKSKVLEDIISVKYEATKVFSYPARKEIWVCYVSKTSQTGTENFALDKAAIWNWQEGTWTFADLPDIYWMDNIISPNTDLRDWNNPKSEKTVTPTEIVLDVPFKTLPVGFNFRVDVLYKPGEGLQQGETLKWESSDETVGKFTKDDISQAADFMPLKDGPTTIKVTFVAADGTPSTDPLLTHTYDVTVGGTSPVLNPQASDTDVSPAPTNPRPDPFPDSDNEWDAEYHAIETWEKRGFSFAAKQLIATSQDTSFYQLDTGKTHIRYQGLLKPVTQTPVVSYVRHTSLSMQEDQQDLSFHKTFRTMYPLISGEGTLTFMVGGVNNPYDVPDTFDRQDFVIGEDYKVDCFTNARFLTIEIRDDGEGDWKVSGMDLDYFYGGRV